MFGLQYRHDILHYYTETNVDKIIKMLIKDIYNC